MPSETRVLRVFVVDFADGLKGLPVAENTSIGEQIADVIDSRTAQVSAGGMVRDVVRLDSGVIRVELDNGQAARVLAPAMHEVKWGACADGQLPPTYNGVSVVRVVRSDWEGEEEAIWEAQPEASPVPAVYYPPEHRSGLGVAEREAQELADSFTAGQVETDRLRTELAAWQEVARDVMQADPLMRGRDVAVSPGLFRAHVRGIMQASAGLREDNAGLREDKRAAALTLERFNFTVALVKPDAARVFGDRQHPGHWLRLVQEARERDLHVWYSKPVRMTREQVQAFYPDGVGEPWWQAHEDFMVSGEVLAVVFFTASEKEWGESGMGGMWMIREKVKNAVKLWREWLGPTDPQVALKEAPSSLRARWGSTLPKNAFHGSASQKDAEREAAVLNLPWPGGPNWSPVAEEKT